MGWGRRGGEEGPARAGGGAGGIVVTQSPRRCPAGASCPRCSALRSLACPSAARLLGASLSSSPTRAGASECSFARRLPSSSQRSPELCRPSRPPSGREAAAPGEAPPVRQSREESERRERESRCPGSRVSETCWSPDAAKSRPKTGRSLPIGCQVSCWCGKGKIRLIECSVKRSDSVLNLTE